MVIPRTDRLLGALVLCGLAGFVFLMARAALAYPGGTYCEPALAEHSFWGNFFCDLTSEVTRRGEDNQRAGASARAGFVCFALALAPFFWLMGPMVRRRARHLVRGLGVLSATATILLAWMPSILSPVFHTSLVFTAAIPGLVAATVAVVGLAKNGFRTVAALGALGLAFGFANAAGYAWAVVHRAACTPWLPAVQKLAAIFLCGWMAAVAVGALRRKPS
jgi:hypothetical protein